MQKNIIQKLLQSLNVADPDHSKQLREESNQFLVSSKAQKEEILNFPSCSQECLIHKHILNKKLFEIHTKNYNNGYNSDFNYLYNDSENIIGTEINIYDLKANERILACELKPSNPNCSLLDKISGISKISNSHLLIMGKIQNDSKGFLVDLKTKAISEIFNFNSLWNLFDKNQQFVYYDNYIFIFGQLGSSGVIKYNINRNTWKYAAFPKLYQRIFSVLFHNYILISQLENSDFFLYDLILEAHSDITFLENIQSHKFLFTDQVRVYLWIKGNVFYESDIDNPFKWNAIGYLNFEINMFPCDDPFDITFSYFEGNIYASIVQGKYMSCYKFNRKNKEMKLFYYGKDERFNSNY